MTDITDTLEENSASDIVADAKAWLADICGGQRLQTHSGNCHKWHSTCLVGKLTREIERLRLAIRKLADQDATLSVCDGSVTVTLDATLTAVEREAVEEGADALYGDGYDAAAATLRKLLERLHT